MGITTEQYRAAIGAFYNYCHGLSSSSGANPLAQLAIAWCFILCNKNAILFLAAMSILLSGDVEIQPGPINSGGGLDSSVSSTSTNSNLLKHKLSAVHLNVQSLTSGVKLSQIAIELDKYDVIALTETWLDNTIPDSEVRMDAYLPPFRRDRNRHGGGVAVYVSEKLVAQRCPEFEDEDIELVWLKLSTARSFIHLACTYRPPNSPASYWDKLSASLSKVLDLGHSPVFILGDLNNNYFENVNDLKQLAIVYNLSQLIDQPTRIPSNTLLDPILTNSPNTVLSSGVLDPFCSDHKPVYVCLNLTVTKGTSFKRTVWDLKHANFAMFRQKLSQVDWDAVLKNSSDQAAEKFTEILMNAAMETIPSKTCTIRQGDKPWMHNEIRTEIRRRRRLHKKAKHTNNPDDWKKFRTQRNKVITLVREAKTMHYNKIVSIINEPGETSTRQWWQLCKSVYSAKPVTNRGIPALFHHDNVVSADQDKAELFNRYFSSISDIDTSQATLPTINFPEHLSLQEIEITEQDVYDITKSLKVSKASGPDNVTHSLLKEAAPVIAKPLSRLFTKSLQTGKFPKTWKEANVCPVYKKGDPHNCNNYRPISLLSCTGKLFERCVFKYLFNYLRDNNLLSVDQSGYIPGDSTVCQLTTLYNNICKALDDKNSVQFVFFDLSKAFDRVWHEGLLYRLELFGVRGKLLSWFQNYLSDRRQRVVLGGKFSKWQTIEAGVPQGSVLGPLLFLIYIDDLAKLITSSKKLFADDTCVYKILKSEQDFRVLCHDMDNIGGWETDSAQKFNSDKTKGLLITLKQTEPYAEEQLTFKNQPVKTANHHKHLGVTFSTNATWYEHILTICRTASKRIDILRGLKYKLSRQALQTIYFSFVRPTFEYADVVWGHAPRHQLYYDLLEKLQLEAARIVTGTNRSISRTKLYEETGWEPLSTRREKHRLILFYKMVNNIAPQHLSNLLPEVNQSVYNLRNSGSYTPPFCRTETYRQSFIPATTRDWNSLPTDLKSAPTLSNFKSLLDKHYKMSKPPHYYFLGNRSNNALLASIRNGVSKLNHDLYRNHLAQNPHCDCGHPSETAFHYFLECPHYVVQRNTMLTKLLSWGRHLPVNINILLRGGSQLTEAENEQVHTAVSDFITSSGRFT